MPFLLVQKVLGLGPFRWISATIRRKAIFGLIVVLLSTVALIGVNITDWARGIIFDGLARQATSVSRFVSLDIQAALEKGGGRSEVLRLMELICGDPGVQYARLVDPQGRDFATSCLHVDAKVLHPLSLAQLDEITPGDARVLTFGQVLDVYRAFPVRDPGGKEGKWYLLMGFDADEAQRVASRVARLIALSALGTFLLGLLILVVAVNRLTGPLETLTRGIGEVGEGRYPGPLPVAGDDEVSKVTVAFNRMVADLTRSREEIGRYQKHLEEMVAARTADLSESNRNLQEANAKLLELDRLKSNFLGIATHELKTPVAVVGGYLEYLQAGALGDLTETQRQVLAAAEASCARMTTLISDMLDLTKIEAGRLPMTLASRPLRGTVDSALAHLAPLIARKGVKVTLGQGLGDGEKGEAVFDDERIIQVVVNLVGNAVKFTPADGTITLSAREVRDGGRGYLAVSVADTGIGISPEDLPLVFEEFAQVGPPGKEEGTGLGLAICRRIVKAHGGVIRVQSGLGEGSVFTFTLPLG